MVKTRINNFEIYSEKFYTSLVVFVRVLKMKNYLHKKQKNKILKLMLFLKKLEKLKQENKTMELLRKKKQLAFYINMQLNFYQLTKLRETLLFLKTFYQT